MSYLQKIPPAGFSPTQEIFSKRLSSSPTQEIYSKRFSSSSSASSISDFTSTYSSTETSQRELMVTQRQIKDLEKKLGDTLAELERVKKDYRESVELNKTHVRRIKQLEQDSEQLKTVNRSLSVENGNYQEKLAKKDAEYEQLEVKYCEEIRKSENNSGSVDETTLGEAVLKESDHTLIEKLQDEVKTLKSDNESMAKYIQKMLNRIMEVDGFEETLATHWSSSSQEKSSKPMSPTNPAKPERPNSLKTDFKFPRSPPYAKTSFTTLKEEEETKHYDEPEEYSQKCTSPSLTTFESLDKNDVTRRMPLLNRPRKGSNSADNVLAQESPQQVNLPKRSSTTNVVPTGATDTATSSKRISGFFKWSLVAVATATLKNNAEAAKKEDPYMKPILLVQAKDKARDLQES
ncbi:11409_t:CDS:2 [Acaulospora colombiana]|uniref:11409_t:CDS:1 n=1 Tax=Acaulospora colombiana TaxID=27376 RepID=A0ACA9JWS2_9GLOM|nr:11409_t:CDS:2 [Acaulospora colombiana]